MNADDRLSLDSFGPVEGGDRIVEGSHVTDVCPLVRLRPKVIAQ